MKAPLYHGPGQKAWEDKSTPTILGSARRINFSCVVDVSSKIVD